jgi:hypothetical protein
MLFRASGYVISPAVFVHLLASRWIVWREFEVWILLVGFPAALVLDFMFRRRPASPRALLWILRGVALACWSMPVFAIYTGLPATN